jgi:2-amino-4-hydroxy-6-hydroxymethyldihydropteridine diphosphokinase
MAVNKDNDNQQKKHIVYLGLGSNIGNKKANIELAIMEIRKSVGDFLRRSSYYETEPWGFESKNYFVNNVICIATALSPFQLLQAAQEIERKLGRTEKSVNGVYHDRTIDIDILLYDDITLNTSELTIPHPLMRERDFVMKPLHELLPSF